jgi:glycosyltransferase involved in cell wall biosynthesis
MDGTPNQLLEAASTGRTFVANKIGNVPEFVNEGVNGFMVQREVAVYVDKLNWMKEHREEVRQMGIEARKTVEEAWTWKIQAENYRQLFRKVLGK